MEYDRHEIEKKKTIDAHMRKLSKANKIIDSKISKLHDAMKKNLVSKKTQKSRLKVRIDNGFYYLCFFR
jgi:cell division protein FtsB